jgi:hypothetical protein
MAQDFNDDGFSGSHSSQFIKGIRVGWNNTKHWHDADGVELRGEMLVLGISECVRRYKDGKWEIIDTKPLPCPDDLNSKIPVSEWQIGIDGKPRPPWEHTVAVYLINTATGEVFTFVGATTGARIAYEHIRDAVATKRFLQGAKVVPLVRLSERPMRTKFGPRTRPHFEIVGWKSPPEDGPPLPTPPPISPTPPSAASPSTGHSPTPQPTPTSNPTTRQPKSSINFTANDTLAAMRDINPVSTADKLNDERPWE